jgi:FkbM family methyltransferase
MSLLTNAFKGVAGMAFKAKLGDRIPLLKKAYLMAINNRRKWVELDGLWYLVPFSDWVIQNALYDGMRFEPKIMDVVFGILKEDSTFIDVGANTGAYTIPAAAKLKMGYVIAIEPRYDICNMLQQSVNRNKFGNASVLHAAATSSKGEMELICSLRNASANVLRGNDYNKGKDTRIEIVNTVRIDDIVPRADLIKMDIDGGELDALKGMTKLFEKCPEMKLVIEVLCEPNDNRTQVFELLSSYGYKMKEIDEDYFLCER